jgi:hypothetical protein
LPTSNHNASEAFFDLPCSNHVQKRHEGRIHRNRKSATLPSNAQSTKPTSHTRLQDTGNKVSRRSQIIGTTNIILGGKTVIQAEVIIRGDLLRTYPSSAPGEKQGNPVAVAIGRYCFFSKQCELRPPGKLYKGFVRILSLDTPLCCYKIPPKFVVCCRGGREEKMADRCMDCKPTGHSPTTRSKSQTMSS